MLRKPRSIFVSLSIVLLIGAGAAGAQTPGARHVPTIDELLSLATIGGASISPDGRYVAYLRSTTDFEADAFVSQIWMVDTTTSRAVQMTRGKASASDVRWSPDGKWLSFISNRHEKIAQVFAMRPDGGEAIRLTDAPTDVSSHVWSPDGRTIAFTASDEDEEGKTRGKTYGDFQVIHREYRFAHLWTITTASALEMPGKGTRLTRGRDWSVDSFDWSPDSRHLAFSATRTPDLIDGNSADIYIVDLDPSLNGGGGGGTPRALVTQKGPDSSPHWSPDGKSIVFGTTMGDPLSFHANRKLAVVPAVGGTPRSITDKFDESASPIVWRPEGVYFGAIARTASHLYRVDPATAAITRVSSPDKLVVNGPSLSRDGSRMAFVSTSADQVSEVFVAELRQFSPRRLTDDTAQIKDWQLGTREVISWKSQDGETIEGVLIKPADYDPTRHYPLLCVIHGGPTGVDRPTPVDARYYPVDLWVARGALVLKVNYRGSAGYGERFRRLNINNLGVGDAWDVLSGIDALIAQGHVDPEKLACMGWSQGGYISAFLTTSTTRFKAISVGAGISDWATYYYNTDITPFTIQYLGDNPAANPDIYRKTSPMSYIGQAKTPTLIQHGELDRRVPIANAFELRQGLEDRGVPVEMVVYKGFGHPITKPKAMRAVMDHNLRWFNHYLFGDPTPDLTRPVSPSGASAPQETKP